MTLPFRHELALNCRLYNHLPVSDLLLKDLFCCLTIRDVWQMYLDQKEFDLAKQYCQVSWQCIQQPPELWFSENPNHPQLHYTCSISNRHHLICIWSIWCLKQNVNLSWCVPALAWFRFFQDNPVNRDKVLTKQADYLYTNGKYVHVHLPACALVHC